MLLVPPSVFANQDIHANKDLSTRMMKIDNSIESTFLQQNDVDLEKIVQLDVETVRSLMIQAEANDFTSEQIQQYVDGQISYRNLKEPVAGNAVLSKDRSYFTLENGTRVPNLLARHDLQEGKLLNEGEISPYTFTGTPNEYVNSKDKTGVYWAVKSVTGYTEATAFITLPTLSNIASKDRPYQFLAANSFAQGNSLTFIGDYGVVYYDNAWHPFINAAQWSDSAGTYVSKVNDYYPNTKITSNYLYLHVTITNGTSTDTVKFEVLDGNDFSKVYLSRTISFTGNPVQPNATNLNLYHETTMAQVKDKDDPLDTTTQSKMSNAKFSQAYLYKPGSYTRWETSPTSDAYKQAPIVNQLETVTLNSYRKWYEDNVTIHFNQ